VEPNTPEQSSQQQLAEAQKQLREKVLVSHVKPLRPIIILGLISFSLLAFAMYALRGSISDSPMPVSAPTPSAVYVPKGSSEISFCTTGVAVPKEHARKGYEKEIRNGIQRIKHELGMTSIWQLFHNDASSEDWEAFFTIAKEEEVTVLVANTEADNGYQPSGCSRFDTNRCTFADSPQEKFLTDVKKRPEIYDGVLSAFLLIDEPYEDINAQQVRWLYQDAKAIIPTVPLVVGWSRELWKFNDAENGAYGFSDGMCDICLISALEYRQGQFDETTLRANQEVSRDIIRSADPEALILSSVQVFGSASDNYTLPNTDILTQMLGIILAQDPDPATSLIPESVDGLMWQSWQSPTISKAANQTTLLDPGQDSLRQLVKQTCQNY
jgi:hypothetical protein